jgi:tetratricopeptide (TPR) repeat protein
MADELLFDAPGPGAELGVPSGTISRPARQAYERGLDSVYSWNLSAADSAFNAATRFDPQYSQAQLWLALVRAWSGEEPARWRIAAEQAALGRDRLSKSEQGMADAVLAEARSDLESACSRWQRLTQAEPRAYVDWYGYAHCLRDDHVVVPDRASMSGWRLRSSYEQAVRAYQRAFELRPAILAAFRRGSYEAIRTLLSTNPRRMESGRAASPDTQVFFARPELIGDSVVLLPYPAAIARRPMGPWNLRLVRAAVKRQQVLFRDIAVTWVTAFPRSAEAMEALAVALEMLEDPAALDTLRRAHALALTTAERVSTSAAVVWMLVKLGTPSSPSRLRQAKALADSLLRDTSAASGDPLALANIAALTGRSRLAASLIRRASLAGTPVPHALLDAPALLVFASLGGPADSVRSLAEQVEARLGDGSLQGREELALEWLGRPTRFAGLLGPFHPLQRLVGKGDYLVDAIAAWGRGDTSSVRRTLDRLRVSRQAVPPGDRAIDAVYAEAILFTRLQDDSGAVAWLDPTLNNLRQAAPGTFDDPARPGALVNAMALRADLAAGMADTVSARRWATAVSILWADADDFLQPLVIRMRKRGS